MARVDHKKIRQLIAQKQKTVTDRQFFSSRAFAAYFADMALAQTRRYGYHRRVKVRTVWEPKNGNTAMTNNELIWLNAGHPSITQHKSRAERYAQLCGLFAHELGHVLYTDFITSQTHLTRLDSGFWYPEPPPLRTSREQHAEEELWDYSGDSRKHQSMVRFIMHDIMNILEDGYIEQRMIAEYPGVLGQNLQARRASTFADMPTLSQVIENEPEQGHVWLTIQQALLSYMKWGELKYGDTPLTDERVQVVFGLLPELDKALLSRDLRDRCRAANLIMVRCWHYIKDFLDHCEEMAEQATPGGDDSVAVGILQQLVSALAGVSAAAEGSSAPATGAPGKAAPPTSGSTAANRAKTAMLAAQAAEESEEETENTAGSAVGAEEQEGDDGTESPTPLGTSEDDEENGSNGSGGLGDELSAGSSDNQQPSNCQTVSDTEQGRLPQRQTDTLSVPEGGTTEHDDTYRGTGYANAASDIARILEAVAEDAVHTSLEKERKRELNELAQSISYSETYKQLCSGEKVTTCSLDLWRGITSNLARCRYGEIRLRDGKQYKRATFDEPVVAVVPGRLGLGRYDDGKLFCSTAYTMVTEDFMGIQFHYPKKVQYEKNGVCGPWFSTKDLNSYQDFENLKTTIRGMTRPLTLKSGDEQRRLDIRITDEAREQIRGCYLFREYSVTVK